MVVYPQINPYEYAKEAIPTDDPDGEKIFPDYDTYFAAPNKPDILITDDTVLTVGDHTFEILCTPGHTPGQLAVVIPEERMMFVGDTIFNGCQTWLYTSDLEQWFRSIDRLLEVDVDLPDTETIVKNQLGSSLLYRAFLSSIFTNLSCHP